MKKMVIMAIGMLLVGSVGAKTVPDLTPDQILTNYLKNPYNKCSSNITSNLYGQNYRNKTQEMYAFINDITKDFKTKFNDVIASIGHGVYTLCKKETDIHDLANGFCLKKILSQYSTLSTHQVFETPDFETCMNSVTQNLTTEVKNFMQLLATTISQYSTLIDQQGNQKGTDLTTSTTEAQNFILYLIETIKKYGDIINDQYHQMTESLK